MNKTSPQSYTYTVPKTNEGQRLDQFLSLATSDYSRTRLKSLIQSGNVTLFGKKVAEPAYRVKYRDELKLIIPLCKPPIPVGQSIPLEVFYEDDDVLVLDKPSGLVVHPAPGNPDKTLVNALISHCGKSLSGIGGVSRPGIVHRLDKDTSGVMVVAKNDFSHRHLARQFSEHSLDRVYLALVWGMVSPVKGQILKNIGRNPNSRRKMAVLDKGGKEAITNFKVKFFVGSHATLVECKLKTGRTHQIRVHMHSIGYPIIGDPLYGKSKTSSLTKEFPLFFGKVKNLGRQALHAHTIGFSHPRTEERIRFQSRLPSEISSLLKNN